LPAAKKACNDAEKNPNPDEHNTVPDQERFKEALATLLTDPGIVSLEQDFKKLIEAMQEAEVMNCVTPDDRSNAQNFVRADILPSLPKLLERGANTANQIKHMAQGRKYISHDGLKQVFDKLLQSTLIATINQAKAICTTFANGKGDGVAMATSIGQLAEHGIKLPSVLVLGPVNGAVAAHSRATNHTEIKELIDMSDAETLLLQHAGHDAAGMAMAIFEGTFVKVVPTQGV
jgi:hypothetical protein